MSDIGVLSHQYTESSDLLQSILQAVKILKKFHFNLDSSKRVTQNEIDRSRRLLSEFTEDILNSLGPFREEEAAQIVRIPAAFVEQIKSYKKGELVYFIDDLRDLKDHLSIPFSELTDNNIDTINEITTILDIETTSVFRKLFRK
jgi:hypothetical protein